MATVHSRAATAAGAGLVALSSSSPQRSREAAEALGYATAASTAGSVISNPAVDVVHICTPNSSHASLAAEALRAGKHVICEKPLAVDAEQARILEDLAQEVGSVATVPFVYRYHPMVREAQSRVTDGIIGRLLTVQGSYLQDWLLSADDDNWRADASAGGASRAFADIGSHLVDLVEFVTGDRIVELCALVEAVHPSRGGRPVQTEDVALVLVRFASGANGTLSVSQTAAGHDNDLRFELLGEQASLRFAQEHPERLEIGRVGSTASIHRSPTVLGLEARRLSIVPSGHPMGYQDAFAAFVGDTYATILGSPRAGLPTFSDGVRAVRLTEAVLSSAQLRAWTTVSA